MKRLAFLGVGSAIILGFGVMGASPAFADNGPHVSTSGQTTVDRCAGCHRAHTGQDAYLLKTAETSLCESCHGNGAAGATTDVMDGINDSNNGALRGGGFEFALLNTTSGVNRTSVNALNSGQATTSTHSIGATGTAWGGGTDGNGTSIDLECGSCHDPHGNGNWRILRPVGSGGAALTFPASATVSSISLTSATVGSRGTTYVYEVITSAPNSFKVTQPVSYYGTTGAVVGANITAVTSTSQFTMSITLSANPGITTASDGIVGYANPLGIAKVSGDGTYVTYTTWAAHGLAPGSVVTSSAFTPSGYSLSKSTVYDTPTLYTFRVAKTTTGTATALGTLSGIADAQLKVYTTTNYWQVDDHNYTGANKATTTATDTAANGGPTAFIANVSQWCATCHTRLLAGSGSYKTDSGDAMFKFMHRSNNGKEGSPNCIQCHVSHGTNAAATGTYSSGVSLEINQKADPNSTNDTDSFLLRVDNRGTCNMCHNV